LEAAPKKASRTPMQLIASHPLITGLGLLWVAFVIHWKMHDSPINVMVRKRHSARFIEVRDNLKQDELRLYTLYSALKWLVIGVFVGLQLAVGPF
jgi:hypothetical protein